MGLWELANTRTKQSAFQAPFRFLDIIVHLLTGAHVQDVDRVTDWFRTPLGHASNSY
jgi:hypothetical protein